MPTYEYRCEHCGLFEFQQRITEDPLQTCPKCGGAVERLISRNVNIIFKGSGFHITDYRSSGYKEAAERDSKGSSADSGSSSETPASAGSGSQTA